MLRRLVAGSLGFVAVVSLILGGCAGSGDGDDHDGTDPGDPVSVDYMRDTIEGTADDDVVAYQTALEVSLASPQLSNLAGLQWGFASAATLAADADAQAALDVMAASPQLFAGGVDCQVVNLRIDEAIAALQEYFDGIGVAAICTNAPVANQCTAAGFLVVAHAVDGDASSAALAITSCASSATPTPTPTPS